MNFKKFLFLIIIFSFIITFSCTVNVFEVFSPDDYKNVNDVNALLSLGKKYLYNNDYTNAYFAYAKILGYDETNFGSVPTNFKPLSNSSEALVGISTAYVFMNKNLSFSNILSIFMSSNQASQNSFFYYLNDLYSVSYFLSYNYKKIVFRLSDNAILYNDLNANLNFFIFNSLNSVFTMIDIGTNGESDMDIEEDSGDWIYITKEFSFSNQIEQYLSQKTNSISSIFNSFNISTTNLKVLKDIMDFRMELSNEYYHTLFPFESRLNSFTNKISDSLYSLNILYENIKNNDIKSNLNSFKKDIFETLLSYVITGLNLIQSIKSVMIQNFSLQNILNFGLILGVSNIQSNSILSNIQTIINTNSQISNLIANPSYITNILFENPEYAISSNYTLEERQEIYSNFISNIQSQGISNLEVLDETLNFALNLVNPNENTNTNTSSTTNTNNNIKFSEIISNYFFSFP